MSPAKKTLFFGLLLAALVVTGGAFVWLWRGVYAPDDGLTLAQRQFQAASIAQCEEAAKKLGNAQQAAERYCTCSFENIARQLPDESLSDLSRCTLPGPEKPPVCEKLMTLMQEQALACSGDNEVIKTNFRAAGRTTCTAIANAAGQLPPKAVEAYCACALDYVAVRMSTEEIIDVDFAMRLGKHSPAGQKMQQLSNEAVPHCQKLLSQ
ncbi:MAG: hypothetical protein LBL69_05430 [Zoogloeaceae bacterium]|jgi:hypothetical protein|nr:hypothetical protein [Zoogloeaceae bacterium]